MNILLINIVLVLFTVFFYKKIRNGMHILQLGHYYNEPYFQWQEENRAKIFKISEIVLLVVPILLLLVNQYTIAYIIEIAALLLLILTTKRRTEKKPFVKTARVKRQYITFLIILIAIFVLGNIYKDLITFIMVAVFSTLAYAMVSVVNIINLPLEQYINKQFCKKAKKKIEDMPNLDVIGITGSYGKTSTKYAVSTILSQFYNTYMTPGSYNTTMGVVKTVNQNLNPTHQVFVCEMGAIYIGDVQEICDIVKPKYGILTAIGPQHLDTFKSIDNVKKGKMELITNLPKDGIGFVNWEDENIRSVDFSNIKAKIVKFGLHDDSDYYATNIEITESGSKFDVVMKGKENLSVKTKLLGKLNILNIVGAVAVADQLGLSSEKIKAGIKYLKPVPHRLELRKNSNGSIIIDDAYNSNVKGAKMALEVLGSFKNKKKILITPGIVALGDKTAEYNENFGKQAAKLADYVILVGEKQAEPIKKGLELEQYPEEKICVVKTLNQALSEMKKVMDNESVILLENDLPDNYL